MWEKQIYSQTSQKFYVWEVKENYSILQNGINKFIFYQGQNKIDYGQYLSGSFIIDNLKPPKNDSSFSFMNYLKGKHVYKEVKFLDEQPMIEVGVKLLRGHISTFLKTIDNEKAKNLFGSILFAFSDQSSLFDSTREVGVLHLIVVSGFHVQVLLLIVSKVFSKVLNKRKRTIINLMIVITLSFALNFSISLTRILIVTFLKLIFTFNKNKKLSRRFALLLAACIHLFLFPAISLTYSFYLSYLVPFSLMIGEKQVKRKIHNFLWIYIKMSLTAYIIAFPIIIAMNHEVNPLSVLFQVIMTPFFMILYPVLFVLMFIPQTHDIVGSFSVGLVSFFDILSDNTIRLVFGKVPHWALFMVISHHFYLLGLLKKKQFKYGIAFIIHIILLWIIFYYWRSLDFFLHIEFINVGNALSVLIRLPHNKGTFLFDAPSKLNLPTREIIPFLKSRQVKELDVVFISHSDNDHSGGESEIHLRIPIRRLVYNDENFNELIFKGVTFTNLNQNYPSKWGDNDRSLVISVKIKNRRFLFTGDVEKYAEERICERDTKYYDIVSVPHHGSSTSSSACFVDWAQTTWAVSSNSSVHNFPRPEVVRRWKNAGALFLSTLYEGNIDFMYSKDFSIRNSFNVFEWNIM